MAYLYLNNTYCSCPEDVKSLFLDQNNLKSKSFRNEVLAYFRDGLLEEWYKEHGKKFTFPNDADTDEKCFKELVRLISGTELTGNISSKFNEIGELLRVEFGDNSYTNPNAINIQIDTETLAARVKFVFKCLKPENNEYTLILNSQEVTKNWKNFNRGQEVVYEFDLEEVGRFKLIEGSNNSFEHGAFPAWFNFFNENLEKALVGKYKLFEGSNNLICDFEINSNTINGHEYVDLGLPSGLKWATCNVGASKSEEYGDYFAWGEVKTKGDFYKKYYDYNRALSTLELEGVINCDGNLTSAYDAASVNWGKKWRMPTMADFEELIKHCKWTWITLGGVGGYKVAKKKDDTNWIFLPAGGHCQGWESCGIGRDCDYWTSTAYDDRDSAIFFSVPTVNAIFSHSRSYGHSVRPVSE